MYLQSSITKKKTIICKDSTCCTNTWKSKIKHSLFKSQKLTKPISVTKTQRWVLEIKKALKSNNGVSPLLKALACLQEQQQQIYFSH